jgi:hypothetical protein
MKFASSPAHILNKNLVSAETGTWLGNHFKVSLSQVKPQVDELFLAGINHIFYHGIAYSPFEKSFPGRLFYAATNFGPSSALWPYMDELNKYITNCQKILQNTKPGNNLLVYYPVFDSWQQKGSSDYVLMQGVHNPQNWLYGTPFGETIKLLWEKGFAFDYISDLQLKQVKEGTIDLSSTYQVLIIPETFVIPLETLRNILSLSREKLRVIFIDSFPSHVPGHLDYNERMDTLLQLKDNIDNYPIETIDQSSLADELKKQGIIQFDFGYHDIHTIRKKHSEGDIIFLSNLGRNEFDQELHLPMEAGSAEFYDPVTGKRGFITINKKANTKEVRLQLPPGKSLFLITYHGRSNGFRWEYSNPSGEKLILNSGWEIHFSDSLKIPVDSLYSWTRLSISWAPYYAGSAEYRITFSMDKKFSIYDRFILDLGKVYDMAKVTINEQPLGRVWHVPFQLEVSSSLLKTENVLSVEVRNLNANRIIQMDKEQVPWKNFYDINFVDITYQPFDASDWEPLPSGLNGPVQLIPLR